MNNKEPFVFDHVPQFTSFDDYRRVAFGTAVYPLRGKGNTTYVLFQLCSEVHELITKYVKQNRKGTFNYNNNSEILNYCPYVNLDEIKECNRQLLNEGTFVDDLVKEAGDVFWYIAALCSEMRLDLDRLLFELLIRKHKTNFEKFKDSPWEKPELSKCNFLVDYKALQAIYTTMPSDYTYSSLKYNSIWESSKHLTCKASKLTDSILTFNGKTFYSMGTSFEDIEKSDIAEFVMEFLEFITVFIAPLVLLKEVADNPDRLEYYMNFSEDRLCTDENILKVFDYILTKNVEKLRGRIERGVIHGDGDNR